MEFFAFLVGDDAVRTGLSKLCFINLCSDFLFDFVPAVIGNLQPVCQFLQLPPIAFGDLAVINNARKEPREQRLGHSSRLLRIDPGLFDHSRKAKFAAVLFYPADEFATKLLDF